MNVFNNIKYPIDINFKVEDLLNLPEDILEHLWILMAEGYYPGTQLNANIIKGHSRCELIRVAALYRTNCWKKAMLNEIRQFISEYEDEHI